MTANNFPNNKLEKYYKERNTLIAGVDEAGRGCIAGPVVAAAVILKDTDLSQSGIADSKVLSPARREVIYHYIRDNSVSIGVGIIDNEQIDEINILQAAYKAMHKAIEALDPQPGKIFIDGSSFLDMGIPYETIIDGDASCLSIAAASIIAKVTRDRWMVEHAATKHPEYDFKNNKGYGTKKHFDMIDKLGPCPLHRKTFLRKYFARQYSMFDE